MFLLPAVRRQLLVRASTRFLGSEFRLSCALPAAINRYEGERCRTVLVSNAGKNTPEIGSPTGRWGGQVFRTLALVQQQAENSRKRILFGLHNAGQRRVAYWGDTPIADYGVADSLSLAPEETIAAATMRTRLNAFSVEEIDLLLKPVMHPCAHVISCLPVPPLLSIACRSELPSLGRWNRKIVRKHAKLLRAWKALSQMPQYLHA